jgi:hypothetical protein
MIGENFEPVGAVQLEKLELDVKTHSELVVEEKPQASLRPVVVTFRALPVLFGAKFYQTFADALEGETVAFHRLPILVPIDEEDPAIILEYRSHPHQEHLKAQTGVWHQYTSCFGINQYQNAVD